MALIKRNNRESLPVMSSLLDSFFDSDLFDMPTVFNNRKLPAVNIKETTNQFEVELAAPGMRKEDFKVSIENQMLIIATEKEKKNEEKKEGEFTRREFSYESFCRTFTLPDSVDADKIKAAYHNGILSLTLPKNTELHKKNVKQIKIG